MKFSKAANEYFIKMCSTLPWNWMVSLPWAVGMTVAEVGEKLKVWIGEIEVADGTMDFRFALIIPRDPTSRDFYILVGGLGSGKWWYWTRRWAALMGDRQLRAGLIYGFPGEKRGPTLALKQLLIGKKFNFEIRLGPKGITRSRKMNSDEFGWPVGGETLITVEPQTKSMPGRQREQPTFDFPAPETATKAATQNVTKIRIRL